MEQLTRRGLIVGLVAAPLVVRADHIMPVRSFSWWGVPRLMADGVHDDADGLVALLRGSSVDVGWDGQLVRVERRWLRQPVEVRTPVRDTIVRAVMRHNRGAMRYGGVRLIDMATATRNTTRYVEPRAAARLAEHQAYESMPHQTKMRYISTGDRVLPSEFC